MVTPTFSMDASSSRQRKILCRLVLVLLSWPFSFGAQDQAGFVYALLVLLLRYVTHLGLPLWCDLDGEEAILREESS